MAKKSKARRAPRGVSVPSLPPSKKVTDERICGCCGIAYEHTRLKVPKCECGATETEYYMRSHPGSEYVTFLGEGYLVVCKECRNILLLL